jgi:Zn-dependent protease with chaperone function
LDIPAAWLALAIVFRLCAVAFWIGLAVLIVGMGIAMFAEMERAGRVYFGPLIASAIALYAVCRGGWALFVGHAALEPALTLDLSRHPRVASLVGEVATKLRTRPADHILLGMSGSFHVFQGKALLLTGQQIEGRILHLSAPLSRILTREELGAVLAHEFAHFTGGDALYSCHVAPVYRSAQEGLRVLWQAFGAPVRSLYSLLFRVVYIPPLVLAYAFLIGFRLIDKRLSRARELRADKVASTVYGREVFASALMRVVGYGTVLDCTADHDFATLLKDGKTFLNYPAAFSEARAEYEGPAEQIVLEALAEPTRTFDTHPSLHSRLGSLEVSPETVALSVSRETGGPWGDELSLEEQDLSDRYARLVEMALG